MSSLLFTNDAQAALQFAEADARNRHNLYIDVENLMLGLLQQRSEPLRGALANFDNAAFAALLSEQLGMKREEPLDETRGMTRELQSLMLDAGKLAGAMGHNFVNGGHLLLAMFTVEVGPLASLLPSSGLDEAALRTYIQNNSPRPKSGGRRMEAVPQPKPKPRARPEPSAEPPPISVGIYVALGAIVVLVYLAVAQIDIFISFGLVVVGWVFSLTLHEFAHALVAYIGGDHTVREKGYLTFNPLRYTHPVTSFAIPLLFLAMGGIGLPGGAVYIEVHRLRSKYWRTAVSLAGPASNALMAVVFAAPFWLGLVELHPGSDFRVESALVFTVMLQVTAVMLNLLPIPPLDGFNAISPYLPPETVMQMRRYGFLPILILFFVFFQLPAFANPFWDSVYQLMDFLNVPTFLVDDGWFFFRFWEN